MLGSKITVDGDCSHKIKRSLLLRRKAMANLDRILKSRDIANKGLSMVFPVIMYGCESWTIKKGECHRIDAFELWCWRRLLRIPWTARKSSQSVLTEIRSDQISCSVVSDSLRPHESQHARSLCPSPTPGVHSDSCPSSQ